MKIIPIYSQKPGNPLNVVVFGSGTGSNLEALFRGQRTTPHLYKISALATDRKCRFQDIGIREGIPVIYHSFANFFKSKGIKDHQHINTRLEYDRVLADLLLDTANKHHFSIDLIVLAGYMRLLTSAFLQVFNQKVINIHPADLSVLDSSGKRIYVGNNAVYDSLQANEMQTRSTVILVDPFLDSGPILVSGPWVKYTDGYPITQDKAQSHQNKQKAMSDWPAALKAVQLIAQGRIGLDAQNNVYIDSIKQSYKGYDLSNEEKICVESLGS